MSYNIKEILICESQKLLLQEKLKNEFLITTYDNWKVNQITAYEKLTKQFKTKSLKGFGLEKNYLAIISSSICIDYVENNFFGKTNHINSITKVQKVGFMHLDSFTIKNLEIFDSLNDNNKNATLYSVINNTLTSAGARMLRNHLNYPLTDKKKIEFRLNTIEQLNNSNKEFQRPEKGILSGME